MQSVLAVGLYQLGRSSTTWSFVLTQFPAPVEVGVAEANTTLVQGPGGPSQIKLGADLNDRVECAPDCLQLR